MSEIIKNNADASPLLDFYKNKVVFLTGVTGVLGELFLEKLLRCNVKRLFILLRSKKNKSNVERLRVVCSSALFDRLRSQDPNYMDRIHTIDGDMGSLNLGISAENIALLNETVQIVIHGAANVRFDCPLHTIVQTNVRGTRELLRLATNFRLLTDFAYISTAFCQSHRLNLSTAEQFYPSPMDPDELIRLAEYLEQHPDFIEDNMSCLTDKIISPWPNTYSFSKAITESLVKQWLHKLPIVVVRPSIVIATHEDPIPGYSTNYFGMNGICLGSYLGIMRVMLGPQNNMAHIVCSDFVINGTLAIIWDRAVNKSRNPGIKESPIYTINSGHEKLTYGCITDCIKKLTGDYPSVKATWRPNLNCVKSPLMTIYCATMYQLIPGVILDAFLRITGNKNRLLPFARRGYMMQILVKFFLSNNLHFSVDNLKDVYSRMTPSDRQYFPVGVDKLDFPEYSENYLLGLRRFTLGETLDTIKEGKRKLATYRLLHFFTLTIYYAIFAMVFWLLFKRITL